MDEKKKARRDALDKIRHAGLKLQGVNMLFYIEKEAGELNLTGDQAYGIHLILEHIIQEILKSEEILSEVTA